MKWDPAKDEAEGESFKAYGAPGIMRQPTHRESRGRTTTRLLADYGTQTRLFHFGPPPPGTDGLQQRDVLSTGGGELRPPAGVKPSRQGYSMAAWTIVGGAGNAERGGNLKVVTSA